MPRSFCYILIVRGFVPDGFVLSLYMFRVVIVCTVGPFAQPWSLWNCTCSNWFSHTFLPWLCWFFLWSMLIWWILHDNVPQCRFQRFTPCAEFLSSAYFEFLLRPFSARPWMTRPLLLVYDRSLIKYLKQFFLPSCGRWFRDLSVWEASLIFWNTSFQNILYLDGPRLGASRSVMLPTPDTYLQSLKNRFTYKQI